MHTIAQTLTFGGFLCISLVISFGAFPNSYHLFSMTILSVCNINLMSDHCMKSSLSEAQKVFCKLHQENNLLSPKIQQK